MKIYFEHVCCVLLFYWQKISFIIQLFFSLICRNRPHHSLCLWRCSRTGSISCGFKAVLKQKDGSEQTVMKNVIKSVVD